PGDVASPVVGPTEYRRPQPLAITQCYPNPPVTLFCVRVSLHNFADPLALKSMYCEVPVVYSAYCRLMVSVLAVFLRTRNPKFEPVNTAPVNGSESGGEQDAGSIVYCVSPPIAVILHSDPAIEILLPFVQFGLKYVFG